MSPEQGPCLVLPHPVVQRVDRDLFLVRFAGDCMSFQCRCLDEGGQVKLDACCQHGCDVNLHERDAILGRAREVASVLRPEFKDPARWFDDSAPEEDPDAPSGVAGGTNHSVGPGLPAGKLPP